MKKSCIIASHVWLFAALAASAQVQFSTVPPNQPVALQSTDQPSTADLKAQKARAKEAQREAKYQQKAAKDRVNATKQQEKAAKTNAKANSQSDQSQVDRAKAAKNDQEAVPQP